jgi:hypothetical protein
VSAGDTPDLPWRTGTWVALAERIQAVVRDHGVAAAAMALTGGAKAEEVSSRAHSERITWVGRLLGAFGRDPTGVVPLRFARQADIRGALVISITRGLRVIPAALREPGLSRSPLTQAGLAEARAVMPFDVACVFDLGVLTETALHVSLFLLDLAVLEKRRDDFVVASRLSNVYLSSPHRTLGGESALLAGHLHFAIEAPILSAEDQEARVAHVASLASMLNLLGRRAQIPDELGDLLADARRTAAAGVTSIQTGRSATAEADRFYRSYNATGESERLEDLIAILRFPDGQETPERQAERLIRLAGVHDLLGRAGGDGTAFLAASRVLKEAWELTQPGTRLGNQIAANAAAARLGWMVTNGDDLSPYIPNLRLLLPDPEDAEEAKRATPGVAHGTRAAIELLAAVASPDGQEALDAARAAGDLALRHLEPDQEPSIELAEVVLSAAAVLADARAGRVPASAACDRLVTAIVSALPWSVPVYVAHRVVLELIALHPRARPVLRHALLRGERTPAVVELAAEVALAEGDLFASPEAREHILALIAEAHELAAEHSDLGQLSRIRTLWHEAAAHLVEAGDLPAAVALCETAVTSSPPFAPLLAPADAADRTRLVVVSGRARTHALGRAAGGRWARLGSGTPRMLAEQIDPFVWRSQLRASLAAFDELIDGQASWFGDVLATAPPEAATTPLAGRVDATPVRVLGRVDRATIEALGRPLSRSPRVVVLAPENGEPPTDHTADIEAVARCGAFPRLLGEGRSAAIGAIRSAEIVHCCGAFEIPDEVIALRITSTEGLNLERGGFRMFESAHLVTVLGAGGRFDHPDALTVTERGVAALVAGGARHVIASALPVYAVPAALFTAELYAALGTGAPVVAAHAAGLAAIHEHRVGGWHPYRDERWWAGITLHAAGS